MKTMDAGELVVTFCPNLPNCWQDCSAKARYLANQFVKRSLTVLAILNAGELPWIRANRARFLPESFVWSELWLPNEDHAQVSNGKCFGILMAASVAGAVVIKIVFHRVLYLRLSLLGFAESLPYDVAAKHLKHGRTPRVSPESFQDQRLLNGSSKCQRSHRIN